MAVERRRILFEGRVQGVGFRMTARRLALRFPLAGIVRNLDDGRVELVIEAEPDTLEQYLQAIAREFSDSIHFQDESVEPPALPPIAGFSIR